MNKLGIRRRFSKLKHSSAPQMQFVDLGLPSGTLWATTNIGAETPYEAGLYFAWGETDGYKGKDVGTKRNFVLTEYKYYGGTQQSSLTKYNDNDQKTILDLEDDAAFVNCGGDWMMPTKEQFAELINDEYVTKVYDNANQGYIITSKINGNSIFLVSSLMANNRPVSVDYGWTAYISNERNLESPSACYAMQMHPEAQPSISAYYSREGGYNIRPVHDRILTFKATDNSNTIKIGQYNKRASGLQDANFEYSLDDGKTWNQYTINTLISLQKNNTIKFRGINNTLGAYQAGNFGNYYFIMTGLFDVSGDVTSLLNNVGGNYDLTYNYSFYNLFKNCTALQVAPNLPSTVLSGYCYVGMFIGCTNLRIAPKLPATSIQSHCYAGMFNGCTSLIQAPELPATTLTDSCYVNMFRGCTSLIKAPILSAINLISGCYNYMFYNCSNLNYIKALFTTDPGLNYTNYWVDGVAETGTFVKNSAATWTTTGVNGVPTGWTVQTANE